jgi:hypothetical protein
MLCFAVVYFNRQSAFICVPNCVSILASIFLYSYKTDLKHGILNEAKRSLPDPLISSFVSDYLHRIYLIELQIRDATYTIRSALYVDTHLEIDSEDRLRRKPYDKTDDFNLPIIIFPLYVATFQQYLHMEYIPFSWYNITEFVVPIMISLKEGSC